MDLALASQGIPSFTISSLTLLSSVLENHPPSAIIVDVGFAQEVIELIMDNREFQNHTLILVGEGDVPKTLEKVQMKVLWLSDLERQGAKEGPLESVAVGMLERTMSLHPSLLTLTQYYRTRRFVHRCLLPWSQ